jgi:hypothetical protein
MSSTAADLIPHLVGFTLHRTCRKGQFAAFFLMRRQGGCTNDPSSVKWPRTIGRDLPQTTHNVNLTLVVTPTLIAPTKRHRNTVHSSTQTRNTDPRQYVISVGSGRNKPLSRKELPRIAQQPQRKTGVQIATRFRQPQGVVRTQVRSGPSL